MLIFLQPGKEGMAAEGKRRRGGVAGNGLSFGTKA